MTFVSRLNTALLAVLALLVLSLAGCGESDKDNLVKVDFPEKLNHRVELRPSDSNESFRFAYVTDEGIKVVEEVEYTNGVTTYLFYRPDQTASKILEFYPPEKEGQMERRLKSEVYLAADGKSFSRHAAYALDGSLIRRGLRNPDGSYLTHYLRAGTDSVEVEVVYDKDLELKYEIAYHEDGSVKTRKERRSAYEMVTISYRADGSKLVEVTTTSSSHKGTFFAEDGVTIKAKFDETSYGTLDIEYFDKEGKLAYEVDYGREGKRTYTVFSGNDQADYRQQWKLVSGQFRCDAKGTYVLVEVEDFHKPGQYGRYNWSDVTDIDMYEDGKTPKKILVKEDGTRRLEVEFHPDGSVFKLSEYDSTGKVVNTTTFNPGEKDNPVTIDPKLLRLVESECLEIPARSEVAAPPQYYYDGPF